MLDDLLITADPCVRFTGEITTIEYLPTVAVAQMGIPSGLNFSGPLTLKAGWRWYKMEIEQEEAFYSEKKEVTPHGPLYDIRIGGLIERDDTAALELLEKLDQFEFLIRFKDGSGRWRLLGNLTETVKYERRDYALGGITTKRGVIVEFGDKFTRPGLIDIRS